MLRLLADISIVAFSWLIQGSVLAGVGILVCRIARRCTINILAAFWLGWALTIAFLQIWHLVLPVNLWAQVVVAACGITGWLSYVRLPRGNDEQPAQHASRKALLLIALATFWFAYQALGHPTIFDSGLYHLQSVKWLKSYAIVPGLGNLHDRLAFNNSSFLYVALLDNGPWAGTGWRYANGLLLLALAAQCLLDGARLERTEGPKRAERLYPALMLIPIVLASRSNMMNSPTPDLPVLVLGILVSMHLLRMLLQPKKTSAFDLFTLLLLCFIGITVKLSFIALGAVTALVATIVFIRSLPNAWKIAFALWATLCIGVLGIWITRGVIQSGYPLYPSVALAAPVKWRVPKAVALEQSQGIRDWSRVYIYERSDSTLNNWVRPWLGEMAKTAIVCIPAALLVLGGALAIRRRPPTRSAWLLLIPAAAGATFWFFVAPLPRYAGASLWVLGCGTLALTAWNFRLHGHSKWLYATLIAAILFCAIGGKRQFPRVYLNQEFLAGHAPYTGFQPMPRPILNEYRTSSGLILNIPEDTLCWDAPLPCTPYPHFGLRLRGDSLASGFVTTKDTNE